MFLNKNISQKMFMTFILLKIVFEDVSRILCLFLAKTFHKICSFRFVMIKTIDILFIMKYLKTFKCVNAMH